jgi:hypothetical protein
LDQEDLQFLALLHPNQVFVKYCQSEYMMHSKVMNQFFLKPSELHRSLVELLHLEVQPCSEAVQHLAQEIPHLAQVLGQTVLLLAELVGEASLEDQVFKKVHLHSDSLHKQPHLNKDSAQGQSLVGRQRLHHLELHNKFHNRQGKALSLVELLHLEVQPCSEAAQHLAQVLVQIVLLLVALVGEAFSEDQVFNKVHLHSDSLHKQLHLNKDSAQALSLVGQQRLRHLELHNKQGKALYLVDNHRHLDSHNNNSNNKIRLVHHLLEGVLLVVGDK